MYLVNDPLFVGIISGTIGAVLAGLLVFYVLEYRRKRTTKTDLMSRLNRLDKSLKSDKINDVLAEYEEVLGKVSEADHPEIYAHIMNNRGICYGKLARIAGKEENLAKAIRAFEEALKIRTVEKYPVNYATTQNNLGIAYRNLAEVRDKEENLTKAIRAFEEALKIYTVEKYPLYYEAVVSNMSRVKQLMKAEDQ